MISLSDETGGIPIVNSGDLAGGLARIVLDNSRYYLLGYYSDSSRWSRNRFMKIEVRVKRPGSAGSLAQGIPAARHACD